MTTLLREKSSRVHGFFYFVYSVASKPSYPSEKKELCELNQTEQEKIFGWADEWFDQKAIQNLSSTPDNFTASLRQIASKAILILIYHLAKEEKWLESYLKKCLIEVYNNAEESKLSSEELISLVKLAATNGDLHTIQELLKDDVVISQKDRGEAVRNAAEGGHLKVMQELLKNGAVILREDWKSAVRCAAQNDHLHIVRELAENVPISFHSRGFTY